MFRGIVEGAAPVVEVARLPDGARLAVDLAPIAPSLAPGQSIAINGACLTAVAIDGARVSFDLAGETLRRTNLGGLRPGDAVNYERAMLLTDRLDGHLVQGHVDGCGRIRSFERRGDDHWLEVEAPAELLATMVEKGSIAVDGISLTLAALDAATFAATIIPHTLATTNLRARRAGHLVNLECDVLLKWLARLTARTRDPAT